MTKEVTKARIIQEIQDKFKLREFEPSPFLFSETVTPVYDIGAHVKAHIAKWVSRNITATGGEYYFAVPDNERWMLNRYVVVFMGAGAYTVSGLYILRKKEKVADSFIYLDLTAGQTVSYMNDLPKPAVLEAEDALYINIDGYTSPQDLRLYIDYTVEELR